MSELELKKTHDFCPSGEPRLTAVFIHGIASSSASFKEALEFLEAAEPLKDVRYVTFDLLGSGKSVKDDALDYGYSNQITALRNSLGKLELATPLVLVGHSMGTLIATKYAYDNKGAVAQLILCSPPVYTEKDLDNPAFEVAMKGFKDAVSVKNRGILKEKAFNQSLNKIVKNRKNYKRLTSLTVPTVLIYGDMDQIIAPYNIPRAVASNPKCLSERRTRGRHSMSKEKYVAIQEVLEGTLRDVAACPEGSIDG